MSRDLLHEIMAGTMNLRHVWEQWHCKAKPTSESQQAEASHLSFLCFGEDRTVEAETQNCHVAPNNVGGLSFRVRKFCGQFCEGRTTETKFSRQPDTVLASGYHLRDQEARKIHNLPAKMNRKSWNTITNAVQPM